MKKIISLLTVTAILIGCAQYGTPNKNKFYSDVCGKDVRGKTDEKFEYGDSFLKAKPKTNAGQDTEFRIELKSKSGYENSDVTTKCVSSTPAGIDCTWLDKTQKESTSKYMIFCVPDDVPIGTVFKYEISVPTIGTLDPRVEVTW